MTRIEDVKQGSRVVFQTADENGEPVKFHAIAMGAALLSYHPGRKSASHNLNLVYLSDAGEAVKVSAAPLLTEAAGGEELAAYAHMNVHAAGLQRSPDGGKQALADELERLKATPRTTGWKPFDGDAEIEALEAELDVADDAGITLAANLTAANGRIAQLEKELAEAKAEPNDAPEPAAQGQAGGLSLGTGNTLADIESANHAAADAIDANVDAGSTGIAPLVPGDPSEGSAETQLPGSASSESEGGQLVTEPGAAREQREQTQEG